MKLHLFACLFLPILAVPEAIAQRGPMDTCQGFRSCDAALDKLVAETQAAWSTRGNREAARLLYPAILSRKTSPLAKARAASAFSELLVDAELYEYAAVQKANANEATRAPSSAALLEHARLVARGTKKDRTLKAYAAAETLAVASANMQTIDALIADYNKIGERGRATALQTQRPALQVQADEACAAINCKRARLVGAKVQTLGPVEYPREARRRLVGECTVTLNVTEAGRPVDLASDCSDPVFVESAMIAVQESEFSPRYDNGVPQPQYNVIMPFSFEPG